jgi:hypothetical protein
MSEHNHQVALFQWAALNVQNHPELDLLFAIPNGGARTARTGAMLKAEGVRAGVPDICLPVRRHGYNALYVELKAPGGRLQKNQIEWQQALCRAGNMAVTCTGWEAAKECIEQYLRWPA